jgi:FxsC-like protein
MSFLFFFSYARDDWKGNYLKIFYDDLVEQVRFITGHPQTHVGFRDTLGIEVGSNWSSVLAEGLACCQTFVPVFTPTYFTRPYCGREWWSFRSRIERYARENPGAAPRLILPILWSAPHYLPGDLHPEITKIQLTQQDLGEYYSKEGLLQIMKQGRKCKKDYGIFVEKYAEKLVSAWKQWTLMPGPRCQLEEVVNFFELGKSPRRTKGSDTYAARGEGNAMASPTMTTLLDEKAAAAQQHAREGISPAVLTDETRGPRYAHFVFVAARRSELSDGAPHRDDAAYDDEGAFWKPYLPPHDDTVFTVATYTARRLKFTPIEIPIDPKIEELLDRARAEERVVVIIIDPWTLLLPRYAEIMKRCDAIDLYNCVILIAWNRQDPQTTQEMEFLRNEVRKTFICKWSNRPANFHHEAATSLETFSNILAGALSRAQNNIIEARGYVRVLMGDGPTGMPIISATLPR